MFKVIKNPVFTATVRVTAPTEGGVVESSFTARFKALPVSEMAAINTFTPEGTVDFLRAILVGWEGVADEAGEPIAFNDASRDWLIDIAYVRTAIINAYNAAMMGAKRGN
ncbi:hypothetical protein [Frigidibacter oleivorans]|uniref:hypothetical protein n=1 Tax=Frigidibacter oleivorans TaxID=2487129 RepID=UPI000F8F25B0|nr:hypothetical protein [Frigidibacter oleivorans]